MLPETAEIATQAAHSGVLGTFGIDIWKFLAQLFNFAVVVFVMWRWAYKPLLKMMDSRSKEIKTGLDNAKRAEKNLANTEVEREKVLEVARGEARGILEQARVQAEVIHKDKMAQVKTEIEKIALEAKQQIRQERETTLEALKGDVADMVVGAAKKMANGIDEKGQRQLIDKAIKGLERT